MCAIKYTARQRIKAVSYKLQLEHWKKEQHVQIAGTHYDKKNKLMTIFKIYFLWNKNDEKWLFLSRFQHLRIATVCARVGGKMLWRWSASNKTERDTTLASSLQMTLPPQLRPLNASSLESTAALVASWSTPNLWPLTPGTTEFITEASAQFAQRGAHPVSGRDDDRREQQWVQVLQMFFTPTPLLPFLAFIFTAHCTQSHKILNTVFQALNLWLWVFSCHGRSHLSWCYRVRKEDPAVPWWKAARYREIWLQECSTFILIEETCACSVHLHWENVTSFSHLWTGIKVLTS